MRRELPRDDFKPVAMSDIRNRGLVVKVPASARVAVWKQLGQGCRYGMEMTTLTMNG